MKKCIISAVLASLSVISGAQAGIPVAIDANPEWAVEAQRWTERLKQWQDTVSHYQKQINAYKQELLTKTGIRDVQGLVQSAQSVSQELEKIYDQGNAFIDDYIKNPDAALSEQAKSLLSDYKVTNTCKGLGYTGDLVRGCEASFLSQLAGIEYGNKLESKLRQDNQTMKDLIEQVKNAKDTKSTQDATNAVALEQLKFEKLKFQYQMYIDKQKQLAEYKKEIAKSSFRNEQIEAKPIDYKAAFENQDFDLIK
ncbi:pilus assembly protein [Salmonella enterica subsp. enterica]|uniref:Pilus assembly protein n=2 Tax=Enterobacteriaceae TaxID=543 RepID=A0A5Y0CAV4_SALTH|nr:pilus assembly protein [Salmonella enterica]EBF6566099.1 pilus assembly protein [Salmonella enterica subsp. enterica serovar Typhimurium]EBW8722205.1 pilus assembly protein [Salmonella enterica subsp. enterica serovar Anatum]ECA0259710.1 pilus assembly protein [Salmonella enterica subsp. enterica serovar Thompson]ECV2732228.1 pilus assembly protein [Salmonella enterica subsp. enterica]EDT2972908.1 pilus assembly protein [Salmonella enterica subsp. enterica serovar Fischerstrasse]EDX3153192